MYIKYLIIIIALISLIGITYKKDKSSNILMKLKEYCKVNNKNFLIYRAIYISIIIGTPTFLLFKELYVLSIAIYVINNIACKKIINQITNYENEINMEIVEYATLLIREFSTNDNLSIVINGANNSFNGTILLSKFEKLYEDILKYGEQKALYMTLLNTKNIWMYSIIYNLNSYVNDGIKDNVLNGLEEINTIIEEQIDIVEKKKIDNNPIVLSNIVILAIALIGFILNLSLNPYAYDYFFGSFKGQLVIITANIISFIIINISLKMSKGGDS